MAALNVLVTGTLNGRMGEALNVARRAHERAPLDCWFCLGDMLAAGTSDTDAGLLKEIIKGEQILPFPVYFVLRDRVAGMDAELLGLAMAKGRTPGVHILEPCGTLTLENGLSLAFVSGIENMADPGRVKLQRDAIRQEITARSSKDPVDILFSFEWPAGICAHSKIAAPAYYSFGSDLVGEVLLATRPSYVFSTGENVFFERDPFTLGGAERCTRFISLGSASGAGRWSYLFKITPGSGSAISSEPGASPFAARSEPGASPFAARSETGALPFAARSEPVAHHPPKRPVERLPEVQEKRPRQVEVSSCWFCLANPASRKHLLVSIGDHVYLALARGGLTDEHLVIVPIEHLPGTATPPREMMSEIGALQDRIAAAFPDKIPVYFVLRQNATHHWHMQCITVPASKRASLLGFISGYCSARGYNLDTARPTIDTYFEVRAEGASLYHPIIGDAFFPAQIGRQAIADLLGVRESKESWRDSSQSETDETRIVAQLKGRFGRL